MIEENRPGRGGVPGVMTAFGRTLIVLLVLLACGLGACTPGAGTPQSPPGSSTPAGNPAAPSIAPGGYSY